MPIIHSISDSEFVQGQKSLQIPLGIIVTAGVVAVAAIMLSAAVFFIV